MDLFRGIPSSWCSSERSAVGVPYKNEISAFSLKIGCAVGTQSNYYPSPFTFFRFLKGYNDHVFSCNHVLRAQTWAVRDGPLFLWRVEGQKLFCMQTTYYFLFSAANNVIGGLHIIYFSLLRLQIIHFSVYSSVNNWFQDFWFPHHTCK